MAENSNINNKVTFWNKEHFEPAQFTIDLDNTNTYISTKTGLDKNGIYFNSAPNYAHIIYNNRVFTAGSRINNVIKKDVQTQYIPNENSETLNVITDITTNPISRTIDYKYSTIDIGYLYSEISRLWAEFGRESKTDKLVIKDNKGNEITSLNNIKLGSEYTAYWDTLSNEIPSVVCSNKGGVLSYDINTTSNASINADGQLVIRFASELPNDSVEETIRLTSYNNIGKDGIKYSSDVKTIKATIVKNQYSCSTSGIQTALSINNVGSLVYGTLGNIKINNYHSGESILTVSTDNNNLINFGLDSELKRTSVTLEGTGELSIPIYYSFEDITGNANKKTNLNITLSSTGKNKEYTTSVNVSLTVGNISPTSITLDPTTITLTGKGSKSSFKATISPSSANTNNSITWSVSYNPSNALSINSNTGEFTANNYTETNCTVTATTGNGLSASGTVTIKEGTTVTLNKLTPPSTSLSNGGGKIDFTADVTHNLFNPVFEWTIPVLNYTTTTTTNTFSYSFPANTTTTSKNYTVNVSISGQSKSANVTVPGQSVKYYWYVGNGDEIAKNDPAAGEIDWTKAQQITSFESLGYSVNGTKITMNKTGENNVYILCPKSWSNKWQFWNVDNTIDLTTGFSEVSELLGISSFTKDGVEYDLWIAEGYAGNIAHMRSK